MEKLFKTAALDEMYKACRDIVPVSRSMNEADELMLVDCFQKFEPILRKTSQVIVQSRKRLHDKYKEEKR